MRDRDEKLEEDNKYKTRLDTEQMSPRSQWLKCKKEAKAAKEAAIRRHRKNKSSVAIHQKKNSSMINQSGESIQQSLDSVERI